MKQGKQLSPENALVRARDLCSRGEYCSFEIMTKLNNWGITGSAAMKIIHILENDRYIDDSRFAESFAHTKAMNSHWGKLKIRLHLIKKHIPKHLIDNALESLSQEEYEKCLCDVLSAKKRLLGENADTYEGRTKIFRYAVTKGYEPALVAQYLRSGDY